jgi:hypothetical protein
MTIPQQGTSGSEYYVTELSTKTMNSCGISAATEIAAATADYHLETGFTFTKSSYIHTLFMDF